MEEDSMKSTYVRETEILNADVVVIGAGGAGLPAAVTAAEQGANDVILIEKRSAP
jgi:succinate dehydrogenase/fumarate reductase flavoprotein subunit